MSLLLFMDSLWAHGLQHAGFPVLHYLLEFALTIQTFIRQVMSLLFNMLSRFGINFLPRSNHLLISWLQSPSTVILEPKKIKSTPVSTFFPFYLFWSATMKTMTLVLWILNFKPAFSLSSFTFIKGLFSSSSLSAIRLVSTAYLRLLIFLTEILIPAWDSYSLAFHMMYYSAYLDFPGGSQGKESTCNVGDLGSIPRLGRSPGGKHGNPL